MTPTTIPFRARRTDRPMLRWIFRRGAHTLTCELDARGRHAFDVSLVPHWNVSASVVERFGDAVSAMERHAAIARGLRRAGWTVVEHASPDFVAAAA